MRKFLLGRWVAFLELVLFKGLLIPLAHLLYRSKLRAGDSIDPTWEPVPWDLSVGDSRQQKEGYRKRSNLPIQWRPVPYTDFPNEGLFGKQREWFISNDIAYVAEHADEELILIQNIWHGFPDPPE